MSYVSATLAPTETLVYTTRLHWSLFWGPIVLGLLATICTAGIGLLLAIPWWLFCWALWATSEYAVTTQRVVLKTGVFRRRVFEIVLSKVESVGIEQGWIARLWNYGTVAVIGTGGSRERFQGIAAPLNFRRAVATTQHSATPASG